MTAFKILMLIIIVPGIVLTAFTAIEHITGRHENQRNYFRFFRGVIVSVLIGQMTAIGFGIYKEYPTVLFLFLTNLYLSSPLDFIRSYKFLYPEKDIPAYLKLIFLPAIPIFLIELYIYSRPFSEKLTLINGFFNDPFQYWMIYVILACLFLYVSFTVLLLYMGISSLKDSTEKKPLLFSVALTLIVLASLSVSFIYIITMDPDLILMATCGISILTILYFLFKNRFPDFFQLLAKQMKQNRYRKTLLKGLDIETIHEHLNDLMIEEQLYKDMDLRINKVAARLLIKPHQLSQILNEQSKTDFRNYINRFRVDEAMRMLTCQPDRSIISICFEVGFSSKTSFNITFKKMTGLSPKEYREKNI